MSYWVYILCCKDNSLYTGITDHLERRMELHNSGKGAKYTRGRAPLILLHKEECPDRSKALKREAEIKKMTRAQKLSLIQNHS
ncbi:MAG: GIY-YIG nuclease family protein [Clostridia bacterium]|nr:GIY-YIG nuclease family protein [Clostridia bacterium]